MDFHSLLEVLEKYDVITIFRHERPDCDALGSQFGLKNWLNENYPNKKVYALGNESSDQGSFPYSDTVDDSIIQKSLAVVLDTANLARMDDQRALMADYIVKVDHHPNNEPYGNLMLVNEKAAAACEILADFFAWADKAVSVKTAEFLYSGLLTDTLCFRTSNTTAATLNAAAFLAGKGINIPELNRSLFDQTLERFRFACFFRSKVEILEDRLAYVRITMEDQKAWNIDGSYARNFIDEIGHVRDFQIWAAFTERETDDGIVLDASLRSKTAAVNDIAAEYNGGGHKNAAGIKNLSEDDLVNLLHKLLQRLA